MEATDTDSVKIRVYTPVGKEQDGKFAMDVTCTCLSACVCMYVHVSVHVQCAHNN